MNNTIGRLWASTAFRVGLSVLGVVVVVALILASTHSSPSAPPTTTETTSTQTVQVPELVGLPATAAQTLLQGDGLTATVTTVPGSGLAGTVLTQAPGPGASVAPGSKVTLTASAGSALPVVPDVSGQPVAQAKAALNAVGFPAKVQGREHSDVPFGDVISTTPPAGTPVPANSPVQMLISQGPVKVRPTPTTRAPRTAAP